ncbi:MAG TPA: hypothetical protein DE060_21225 [Lentisphaeria bacterium]|nr:hypothetical protein [Lentisphaeria bacterium]HCG51711.1 hypothetical protein [Lentisphaeria bacterium]
MPSPVYVICFPIFQFIVKGKKYNLLFWKVKRKSGKGSELFSGFIGSLLSAPGVSSYFFHE